MTAPSLQQAAQQVLDAELAALQALQTAVDTFYATTTSINDSLTLPTNFPSNAKRLIFDMQSMLDFRRTNEIPQLITNLAPPAE